MSTTFDINHDGYLDINEQLLREVRELGRIISDLNTALLNIPEAIWGDAELIYREEMADWNQIYGRIHEEINEKTMSSIDVHEIYKNGDYQGTRIMLG
ncbi:hypothetical protein [Actinophytocola xanthii]|uniref:Uncharacterized protein n=1 Tax=Actinophytocola xanthii TaxID=1912961 RepID=A0A1Q8CTE8_9PSEU|nr:hypothetical protein [Actinophytocola xanthii]OLF17633.1 hypothetical protein BU204_10475 [Actinophytocola xanthii]